MLQAVEKEYAGRASDDHLGLDVEFQKDTITLTVPVEGEVLENGWEITPLTPPTVSLLQTFMYRSIEFDLFNKLFTCRS